MGTTGNLSLGGAVSQIGGAVGSLFNAEGNAAEANSYTSAAQLEQQNAQLTAASTQIQETQAARTVAQSLGTTQADIAGAGFTESGSALDILRSSAQQGALANSLVNIQGAINENAYAAEAGSDYAKAKAANEASTAGTVSAIASIGGALINGGTQLASAGNTVASGYNTIMGWINGTSTSATASITDTSTAFSAANPLTASANTNIAFNPALENASLTDQSLNDGQTLLDTSSLQLGTSTTAASTGISQAGADITNIDFSESGLANLSTSTDAVAAADAADAADAAASTVADAVPVAGEVLAAAQVSSDLTQAGVPGLNIGGVSYGITDAAGSLINGAINAVSSVGSAIGSAFGSVICTALNARGRISDEAWLKAQQYGRQIDHKTFVGYLRWASPIAKRIIRDRKFAGLMALIFIPAINEMAYIVDGKGQRTLYGILSHRVMFGLSWGLGRLIRENRYVKARA